MNTDVLPYLGCPVCGGPLTAADGGHPAATSAAARPGGQGPRAVHCPQGHSFDIARQGYVHLGTGRSPHSGDAADMVAARVEFLAAGHYDFLSEALAGAAAEAAGVGPAGVGPAATETGGVDGSTPAGLAALVVDAGAGTGRHLAAVLDALPGAVGLALDVSKPALRRAARAHPRAGAALCDTWGRLPLADAGTAVLLNVFAPRNGPEFRRILRPDGILLVATPEADHLAELVTALDLLRVDPEKPARVAASLGPGFVPAGESVHRRILRLTRPQARALVGMGPSAWHGEPAALDARVAALPQTTTVTAAVRLCRYRTGAGST
jgi:23S rRNA (guanine745-N1)-methyltransferase